MGLIDISHLWRPREYELVRVSPIIAAGALKARRGRDCMQAQLSEDQSHSNPLNGHSDCHLSIR